jgi:transferase family protein
MKAELGVLIMELKEQRRVTGNVMHNDVIPLTSLDVLMGMVNSGGVYFFNGEPDVGRMQSALTRALDLHPTFGASLQRIGERYSLLRNNRGISFSVFQSNGKCPDPAFDPILEGSPLLDDDHPLDYWLTGSGPLMSLRVVRFADHRFSIGVRNIHCLVDGASLLHFLRCWSAIHQGLPEVAANPLPRQTIAQLGIGDGIRPSDKLSIAERPIYSVGQRLKANKSHFATRGIEIPNIVLDAAVKTCKSKHAITSSDLVHALVWYAFAASAPIPDAGRVDVFTVCDIRRVRGLNLPTDFEGNALLERKARAAASVVRSDSLVNLAASFCKQVKPLTVDDVGRDIAFLNREYSEGRVMPSIGFATFVRGALDSCLQGTGIFVNDMRSLDTSAICFGECADHHEVLVNLSFPCVSVYRTMRQTTLFRVVVAGAQLDTFEKALKQMALFPGAWHSAARGKVRAS